MLVLSSAGKGVVTNPTALVMSPRSDIDTATAPITLTSLRVATGDPRIFHFRSTAFRRHPSRFRVRCPSRCGHR